MLIGLSSGIFACSSENPCGWANDDYCDDFCMNEYDDHFDDTGDCTPAP